MTEFDETIKLHAAAADEDDDEDETTRTLDDEEDDLDDEEDEISMTSDDDEDDDEDDEDIESGADTAGTTKPGKGADKLLYENTHSEDAGIESEAPNAVDGYTPPDRMSEEPTPNPAEVTVGDALKSLPSNQAPEEDGEEGRVEESREDCREEGSRKEDCGPNTTCTACPTCKDRCSREEIRASQGSPGEEDSRKEVSPRKGCSSQEGSALEEDPAKEGGKKDPGKEDAGEISPRQEGRNLEKGR